MPTAHPLPPSHWLAALEAPRAMLEASSLLWGAAWRTGLPRGDGHPVITVPGFAADDGTMAPLRAFLKRLGYDARPWMLGRNLWGERITAMDDIIALREQVQARLAERIADVHRETGEKVSLVGWSLGGIYANALACEQPRLLRRVITLGSPFGDPRATKAWKLLQALNRSDVPEEGQDYDSWLATANRRRRVPTTVIYSPSDGIVAEGIAQLAPSRHVENIPVHSSHIGFALNPLVYRVIAERLASPVS